MRDPLILFASLSTLLVTPLALALSVPVPVRDIVYSLSVNSTEALSTDLSKRAFSGRFTFGDSGLGACGSFYQDSDFVVSLNTAQFGNGQNCGRTVNIVYQGRSAKARVLNSIPFGGSNDLDLTRGLFQFFAPLNQGQIQGTWSFV